MESCMSCPRQYNLLKSKVSGQKLINWQNLQQDECDRCCLFQMCTPEKRIEMSPPSVTRLRSSSKSLEAKPFSNRGLEELESSCPSIPSCQSFNLDDFECYCRATTESWLEFTGGIFETRKKHLSSGVPLLESKHLKCSWSSCSCLLDEALLCNRKHLSFQRSCTLDQTQALSHMYTARQAFSQGQSRQSPKSASCHSPDPLSP